MIMMIYVRRTKTASRKTTKRIYRKSSITSQAEESKLIVLLTAGPRIQAGVRRLVPGHKRSTVLYVNLYSHATACSGCIRNQIRRINMRDKSTQANTVQSATYHTHTLYVYAYVYNSLSHEVFSLRRANRHLAN